MGGETTVTLRGAGLGGRNLEVALAAALTLEGAHKVVVMTLATDGVDGPTDAAGAVISGETITKARAKGLEPEIALNENNSYPILDALGSLIKTGPTGTNLNDLVVGLVYR
jgi:hydroxypyruvate reductase